MVLDLAGVGSIEQVIPSVSSITPYPYETIRNRRYDSLIDSFLSGSSARSESSPTIFHMGGIPGSGKTTYYKNNRNRFGNYMMIGFDHVMENIDEYRTDNTTLGSVESYSKWVLVARVMGYELILRSLKGKLNIFLDHGGLCDPHVSLLRSAKDYGYRTKMCFIRCGLEVACERALEREKVTHRHIPREIIEQRFFMADGYLEAYRGIVDDLIVIDS
ncbi:MAG: zeta toxin family protein [Rickettsiales bacterium]|jgi:predicted ABC-type ATPase|nr:zeta toxin family protein [Rickettsiales bacterium]